MVFIQQLQYNKTLPFRLEFKNVFCVKIHKTNKKKKLLPVLNIFRNNYTIVERTAMTLITFASECCVTFRGTRPPNRRRRR